LAQEPKAIWERFVLNFTVFTFCGLGVEQAIIISKMDKKVIRFIGMIFRKIIG
jgi:hypothetical protein